MSRAALPMVLLGLALLAASAAQAADSALVWRTLETDHFTIHYYEPNEDIGRRVAVVAETAHRDLSVALDHQPAEKTHLVLLDSTDGANGFANVSPRDVIVLYVTAPGPLSVLNDHDDWLYGLVAHEYSHILHLDTAEGLPTLWNRIWGKIWLPNQIQPRWFIEGLATYEESKRSSAGRTRSALFDMYLRSAVLAGRPLGLDQISAGPQAWPHGNAVYLYGAHFLKYIADRYGDDKIAKISHGYGSHVIPWNLGRAVRRAVGKNFDELYDEWLTALRAKYALEEAAARRTPLVEGRRLTATGEGNASPRFSPDGREIYWLRSDGKSRLVIRALAADGDQSSGRDVAFLDGAGAIAPLPDGSGLVAAQSINYRTSYDFTDLVRIDTATGRATRLSHGIRASDPDVSPDGTRVAFAMNGRSRWRLAVMSLAADSTPEVVWEGPARFDQAFSPSWSPDGRRLAFSAWTEGGYRDLYVLDLAAHTTTRLTHDRAQDLAPRWSPDGRSLYWPSDRTGIYDVYAMDLATGDTKQVTNVLGGALSCDVSPDGRRLVYMGYGPDGYDLYELPLDPTRFVPAENYVDDRPDPVTITDAGIRMTGPRRYRALETLAPLTWDGQVALDSFGSAFSVMTGGSDVVGQHAYSLGATVGTTRGDVSFGAGYAYQRLWPTLQVAIGRSIGQPGGRIVDGHSTRYTEEAWGATGSVGLPVLRRPGVTSDLTLAYDVDWQRAVDGVLPTDPAMPVPVAPETGVNAGLALYWSLSGVRRFAFSLGPADGRSLGLGLRIDHPGLGSDFTNVALSLRWQEYWSVPWSSNQIVSLRLVGGVQQSGRRRGGLYFLGGLPQQDVVTAIVDSLRTSSTGILRGYAPGSVYGDRYELANLEYRVRLADVEKGYGTLPVYMRRLHMAALMDVGGASMDTFDPEELRVAIGGALRLDTVFGFFADGTFEVGYARGLSQGGMGETWFLLTQTL